MNQRPLRWADGHSVGAQSRSRRSAAPLPRDRGVFGTDAERYDRARLGYPRALVDAVLADLPGRSVLDVGIGTGVSAAAFRDAGCTVVGIDVDARMAAAARRRGFEVDVATFEDRRGDRRFDAVIAGQTWHWIDPVAGSAPVAEVLRPRGRVALFWNVGDPGADLAAAFARVYRSVRTGLPFTPGAQPALDGTAPLLAAAAAGLRGTAAFDEPEQWRFDWETVITRDDWLDQVPTAGGHSRMPQDKLDELLEGLGRVIDDAGGRFVMRYTTVALTALRPGDRR